MIILYLVVLYLTFVLDYQVFLSIAINFTLLFSFKFYLVSLKVRPILDIFNRDPCRWVAIDLSFGVFKTLFLYHSI